MRKKLAIVGFAPDSRGDVKNIIDDKDFEIWGLNELYLEKEMQDMLFSNRANAWFQLHGYEPPTYRDPEPTKSLAKLACPVYMWGEHRDIPNSIKYPLDDVLAYFDIFGKGMCPTIVDQRDRVYFTNSISWMIALGIYFNFEEIHIYGVNMAQIQEYGHQRPSCEFFIGWARGKGIKIHLPAVSDLCMAPYLYGFDDGRRIAIKYEKRIQELEQRLNQARGDRVNLQNQASQILNTEHALIGAKEDVEYISQMGAGTMRGKDNV